MTFLEWFNKIWSTLQAALLQMKSRNLYAAERTLRTGSSSLIRVNAFDHYYTRSEIKRFTYTGRS